MLENRPLLQRALYASGAFTLVFTAAMAGTGVMMTGGPFQEFTSAQAHGDTFPDLPEWTQSSDAAPAPDTSFATLPANVETDLDGGPDPGAQYASYTAPAPNEHPAPDDNTAIPSVRIDPPPAEDTDATPSKDPVDNEAAWVQLEQNLAELNAEQDDRSDDLFGEQTVRR